ncbi:MAG: hypothetical protein WKF37_04085 [Bryobacteraceae bacterium]
MRFSCGGAALDIWMSLCHHAGVFLRNWWLRLREALDENMRQQITRLGLAFTLTVVLVGFAAFASGNNLLFLLLAALMATLLISGFVSRLGLAGLELDLSVPSHVVAKRKLLARLNLKNGKWMVPSFSLHLTASSTTGLTEPLYIPLIPAGTTLSDAVEIYFPSRGAFKENTFTIATRFPSALRTAGHWYVWKRSSRLPCHRSSAGI